MKKIVFSTSSFGIADANEMTQLRNAGFELIFNPLKKRLTESEIISLLDEEVVGVLAGLEPLNRKVLSGAKNLRVISRCGTGLDNVDLKTAQELDIAVLNTPDAVSLPVAEMTIALMLNLLRKICDSDREMRSGVWSQKMGNLLAGKVVGIIGFGRIGQKLASLLSVFGVKVVFYDPYVSSTSKDVTKLEFEQLLATSDIVTLHSPLTHDNYHLIGSDQINIMKEGAYLLNLARGGLVDEFALMHALENRSIAGAAIDVYENEPYQGPLSKCNNLIMTAHMGSYAAEARALMEREALSNLTKKMTILGLIGEKF